MALPAFFKENRIILSFFLIAFVLYGNTLSNGYALDDEFVTGPNNVTAKGLSSIKKIFSTFHVIDEGENNYEYRPIVKVSFALEHQIFGVHPGVGHFFNVVLYGVCLVLLYKLLLLVFNEQSKFVLYLVVLVYACLPIHSEVVVSLKNRDVLLSFIFTIGGFLNFLKYLEQKKIIHLGFAILLISLAFLSKFDVLPFLAIIPITVYQKQKTLKGLFIVIGIFLVSVIVYKLTKRGLLDKTNAKRIFKYFENPMYFNQDFALRISATLNSLGFYVKMLLWPSKMACYYGYNVIPIFSFTSVYALTGIVAFGALLYFFLMKFRKADMIWFGILFFSASISMYLNFVKPAPGIVADRFLFFASIGFALILVQLLITSFKGKSSLVGFSDLNPSQKTISVIFLVLSAILIINRNKEWKDKLTLFETDSNNYPESVKLALLRSSQTIIHLTDNSNLIKQQDKTPKIHASEKVLMQALKVDSSCAGCYNNLSYLLLSYDNDPSLALQYLYKGYAVDSTRKELLCNIGIAYMKLNNPDSAEKYLLKAVRYDKKRDFLISYDVLQSLYLKYNVAKGIRFFEDAVEEMPSSEPVNVYLAKLYFANKDTANSLVYYKKALQIRPDNQSVREFVDKTEKVYFSSKKQALQ